MRNRFLAAALISALPGMSCAHAPPAAAPVSDVMIVPNSRQFVAFSSVDGYRVKIKLESHEQCVDYRVSLARNGCHRQASASVMLVLHFTDGSYLDSTTDSAGIAFFDLVDASNSQVTSLTMGQSTLLENALTNDDSTSLADAVESERAERDWVAPKKDPSAPVYRKYLDAHPKAHHSEAWTTYAKLRSVELEIDVGVALAAKDLHKAETLLAEWKEVDPDGAQFHARTTEHARLVRDARLGEAGLAFDSAITVIVAKHGATANNLAIAEEQLNELQALDPADPNIARRSKQFADARRRVMDTLIVTARRSIDRQGWFDAMSALDGAQKVAPDDPRVPQLRKEMEHQQETAQRDQERRLDARDGPYWLIQATCPLGNGADHTTNVMALRAKLQNNALSRFCLEEVCHPEAGDVDGRVNDQCKRDCLSGKVPHRGRGDRCRLSVKRGDCELATTRDYNCVQR